MAQSFLPPALQSHPEWEWAWGFASRKAMVMTEHPLEGDLTQFPRTSNICIFFHPLGLWREVMTWAALRRGSCDRMLQVWLLTKSFVNEFTRRSFPTQPWQWRLSHIWLQPYERTQCRGYRFLTQKWQRNMFFRHSVSGSFVTQQALTHVHASIRCKLRGMGYSCSENGITVKWTDLSFYLATQEEAGLVLCVGKPWP